MPKKLPYVGVYFYERPNGRFVVQFKRPGLPGKKTITLTATSEALAYSEAVEFGRRFEVGAFNPWTDRIDSPLLADETQRFLEHNSGLSTNTLRERRIVLEAFSRSVAKNIEARGVTSKHVERFCLAPHLKPSTQKGYLSKVRSFFNWLKKEGYLRDNPCIAVKEPRVPRNLPEYLSREEVGALVAQAELDALLSAAPGWMPDAIRLAVSTGLRRAELCALRWCDVDFPGRNIYVRGYESGRRRHRTKSGHDRRAPMLPISFDVLVRLADLRKNENEDETVLVSSRAGPLDPGFLGRKFSQLRRRVGLRKEYSFHTLRHTFASWLVSEGVPIRHVQEYMGHADMKTTMIYAHLVEEHSISRAAAAMRPLDEYVDPVSRRGDESVPVEHELKISGQQWIPVDSEGVQHLLQKQSPKTENALSDNRKGVSRGAEHRARTGDLNLGKVALYQLS